MEWLTWLITTLPVHIVINCNNVHSMDVIMLARVKL